MATVYYLELLTRMVDTMVDQGHPRILLQSISDSPDRTAYITGKSTQSPLPLLVETARSLQNAGADFLTIPCVTAHYFYEQLTQAVDITIINLVEETAEQLAVRGARKVGILATTGVHQSGVLAQAIRDRGIEVLLPDPDSRERLMYIIYKQIKAGRPADLSEFEQIAENMLASGADCLVLGCTELPLLKREPELAQHVRTKELLENDCSDRKYRRKIMEIVCLDLEGVLVPEIWIAFSEATGIPELKRTTRDEPDYDKLMNYRLDILREHGLGLKEIQETIAGIDPLPGAKEFLDELRSLTQVIIISDTFSQFAGPLMKKLGYPTIFCNELIVAEDGEITGFKMRCEQSKLTTVKALQSIGYDTIASGDSHNDLGMILASKAGFLFKSTDAIKKEYPQLPAYETYEELMAAIKEVI